MLTNLHIENIAVIERASLDFQPGLNVLTGETGAGKSIIIDSLNAVLGERTSRELIRTGTDRARVTAAFEHISDAARCVLEEQGFSEEDGVVLVQREWSVSGKNSFRINGVPAPAAAVRAFGRTVLNIHGQHDNQQLLAPQTHIQYFDALGGLQPQLAEYEQAYRKAVDLKHRLAAADTDEQEKAHRIEMLQYQIQELEDAGIRIGERAELMERRTKIQNTERIRAAVCTVRAILSGDEETAGSIQLLKQAADQLRDGGRFLPELRPDAEKLESLSYELEDVADHLRELDDDPDDDPTALDLIEERLDLLYRLGAKYGGDEESMLHFLEKARSELDQIEHADAYRQQLANEYRAAGQYAKQLALALSDRRLEVAAEFTRRVTEELAFLDMPRVQLTVSHEYGNLNATGCDRMEIQISANPGEPPKPLAKIASGGEMSRIMLAIKNVLADKDGVDTLIFDEVDTGISGRAALKVGRKLRQVSANRQVLCVTHLAQIAAHADAHLLIEKKVRDNRTFTEIRTLDHRGRCAELARIMNGADQPTASQLASAEELLKNARES